MSICPKNKSSKGRRDKRRANWKMTAPNLVKCSKCGELMMSHRVCKNCGYRSGLMKSRALRKRRAFFISAQARYFVLFCYISG